MHFRSRSKCWSCFHCDVMHTMCCNAHNYVIEHEGSIDEAENPSIARITYSNYRLHNANTVCISLYSCAYLSYSFVHNKPAALYYRSICSSMSDADDAQYCMVWILLTGFVSNCANVRVSRLSAHECKHQSS